MPRRSEITELNNVRFEIQRADAEEFISLSFKLFNQKIKKSKDADVNRES